MTFEYNGFNIHLIDTPGFDNSIRSDAEILMTIATYLSAMYKSKKRLDGIVYISPITDTRMSGSAVGNLDRLSMLVGDEALSEVVLVTSKWDLVADSSVAEDREKALRERLWKSPILKGSRVCRLDPRRLMALHILDVLLPGVEAQGKVLQIQRKLVDDMSASLVRQIDTESAVLTRELQTEVEGLRPQLQQNEGKCSQDLQECDEIHWTGVDLNTRLSRYKVSRY